MRITRLILIVLTVPCLLSAAEKVVSLSPALTQLVMLLDGAGQLCGRSSACYFPEVEHLPVVGDLGRPFPEAVLQSGAEVVICDVSHPEANWQILQRCGVRVELFSTDKIGKLPENLQRLGELLGRERTAEQLAGDLVRKIARLRIEPPAKKFRAVVLFSTDPAISCGQNVFISDVLQLAGVENIAAGAGSGYFMLSAEFIYREDPDWELTIGIPENAVEQMLDNGLLRMLPAVKKRRIITLDIGKWGRLTPEIIDAAEKLRHDLHD